MASASENPPGESQPVAKGPINIRQEMFKFKFKPLVFEETIPRSREQPKARSGHRMIADESGDLYSFGGFNLLGPPEDSEMSRDPLWQKHKPLFQELWKFNWTTKSWCKLDSKGDVPDKLVSHCMCYWNDKIITYGGTGLPYGENSSNQLTVYHTAENHWEIIKPVSDPTKSPDEMYGQACVCDDTRGELYIVGGTNGSQYSLDVHKFNLHTKQWAVLHKSRESESEPGQRYRHEIALHNNKLFIFGGSTSSTYYNFDTLPVFDIETRDWTYCHTTPHLKDGVPTYPEARKCHSLSIIGNDCYICGGISQAGICTDLWRINLEELKWSLLVRRIPYPVYFHAAAMGLGARLTIFGGVDNANGESRNAKLTTIWLKIPSLKNICLSAVEFYVLNRVIARDSLSGLPSRLKPTDC